MRVFFLLVTFFIGVSGLSACEKKTPCGNGVIDDGEECDGTQFGDRTCASLGGHGGELVCTPHCRIDRSACAFCGDGVLQPEYGEVVEVNFDEGCSAAGFLGGVSTTTDCRTLSTRHCGDLLLFTSPVSVKSPVITFDEAHQLWMTGVVQGAFPGFENPGCPRIEPLIWEDYVDGETIEVQDWWISPDCDNTFFGQVEATSELEALWQDAEGEPPFAMLDMGDSGWILLHHGADGPDSRFVIDWISKQGVVVHREVVHQDSDRGIPQLVSAGPDEFALVTYTNFDYVALIRRFSVSAPGPGSRIDVESIEYEGDTYRTNSGWNEMIPAAGSAPGVYRILTGLTGPYLGDDIGSKSGFFLITVDFSRPAVTYVVALDPPTRSAISMAPWGEAMDLELAGYSSYDRVLLTHGRLGSSGNYTEDFLITLPETHTPEVMYRMPDGGWLIGGNAYTTELLEPLAASCDARTDPYRWPYWFAWRVNADGTVAGKKYFTAPGMRQYGLYTDPAETSCGVTHHRFLLDGEALLVAGSWDRSTFFCTSEEPVAKYQEEPLHTCGVYMIRLEPEPALP
ncbi:MAG: hypothetical protein CVU59_11620 [Deltaproteobacteria bacterium HGW-Deltaproteobacteria-17]|nr:MAG: hypothetical protein CVU59_11620 [Deltaproteobacteria bacterium HGW-Deltaproteobacteria-17]